MTAVHAGVDPQLFASLVAVESGCNVFAVSSRGAIGLTQVMPKVWLAKFDFEGRTNLFNPSDNLSVGARILGVLVSTYGTREALNHYQGTGPGADTSYTERVLALARR